MVKRQLRVTICFMVLLSPSTEIRKSETYRPAQTCTVNHMTSAFRIVPFFHKGVLSYCCQPQSQGFTVHTRPNNSSGSIRCFHQTNSKILHESILQQFTHIHKTLTCRNYFTDANSENHCSCSYMLNASRKFECRNSSPASDRVRLLTT